ncbi:MAG: DUF445 family protein [Chloracidobacterium sp.]|nr:DUF445 family protein [Chloracidobacterium sp.]MDW8216995.1 DUF445 family protein [Acidobacteriota bacterium]
MNLLRLLSDCSPLVIATAHGYGAAWLAVKMLFRPLKPVYLFGWKLPFTPGLLPAERDRFVDALAGVIAEKLLTADILAAALHELRLDADVERLARSRYAERSQSDALLPLVAGRMTEMLATLKHSSEAKWRIAHELRAVVVRRLERDYHPAVRQTATFLVGDALVYRIVDRAINELADQLSESMAIREVVDEALRRLPEAIFSSERPLQKRIAQDLVRRLSERLDIRGIIKRRFETFSNDIFESLVYETAGRELRGIMTFGTYVGLVVGVLQTSVNLWRTFAGP